MLVPQQRAHFRRLGRGAEQPRRDRGPYHAPYLAPYLGPGPERPRGRLLDQDFPPGASVCDPAVAYDRLGAQRARGNAAHPAQPSPKRENERLSSNKVHTSKCAPSALQHFFDFSF